MRMKAMVALYHESEEKSLFIQTGDLWAFLAEFKENPQGYVVMGVKPLGEIDPALWEEAEKFVTPVSQLNG